MKLTDKYQKIWDELEELHMDRYKFQYKPDEKLTTLDYVNILYITRDAFREQVIPEAQKDVIDSFALIQDQNDYVKETWVEDMVAEWNYDAHLKSVIQTEKP